MLFIVLEASRHSWAEAVNESIPRKGEATVASGLAGKILTLSGAP